MGCTCASAASAVGHVGPPAAGVSFAGLGRSAVEHVDRPAVKHVDRPAVKHVDRPAAERVGPPAVERVGPPTVERVGPPAVERVDRPAAGCMGWVAATAAELAGGMTTVAAAGAASMS